MPNTRNSVSFMHDEMDTSRNGINVPK